MSRDIDYSSLQKRFRANIGDIVYVSRRPTLEEQKIWDCTWAPEMNNAIGHNYDIKHINKYGIHLKTSDSLCIQDGCWIFPYFVLRIVR